MNNMQEILRLHSLWVTGKEGGSRANLFGADLRGTDLSCVNLSGADLSGVNLSGADLRGSNLYNANLSRADLRGADLSDANLSDANLRDAKLSDANLRDANLIGARIDPLDSKRLCIVPDTGSFTAWKKCQNGVIAKLEVGETAKRSNATGRKCRAEWVRVLEVFGAESGLSMHDGKTLYQAGKEVHCDKWEENRWVECGGGIHFYITREEAEAH